MAGTIVVDTAAHTVAVAAAQGPESSLAVAETDPAPEARGEGECYAKPSPVYLTGGRASQVVVLRVCLSFGPFGA